MNEPERSVNVGPMAESGDEQYPSVVGNALSPQSFSRSLDAVLSDDKCWHHFDTFARNEALNKFPFIFGQIIDDIAFWPYATLDFLKFRHFRLHGRALGDR